MTDTPRWDRRHFLGGAAAVVAAAAAACAARTSSRSQASGSLPPTQPAGSSASSSLGNERIAFVSAAPRTKPLVALTFHVSGDRSLALDLLDLLRQHGTLITAFMVGTFVEQNGDIVQRIAADGHEIANHTYSHLTFASLSRQQMSDEITRCRDALTTSAGSGGALFRPSGTSNGTDPPSALEFDVATAAGYRTVLGYDVDPSDYADPGAAAVATRVVDAVRPGSIVSLHFGHRGTIDALPDILAALDTRGLRPVTASTLLAV